MKKYTEYSVEVRIADTWKFIRQVDIFDTYEEAESFINYVAEESPEDQEYIIMGIDYEEGSEMCYYEEVRR